MNIKIAALLIATATATIPAAIAATVAVEPLNYATGYVAAVDMTKGTVTINGKVFAAKPADLYDVQPGTEIEIWFDKNAQAAAVAVKPAAEDLQS